MFVLPPPPRYPAGYPGAPGGGPIIETNNILTHPSGPEHQLVVGEGTYVLRDDLLLATPPPHPSEAPIHNPNPLATTISPPSSGTKISLVVLAPRQQSYSRLYRLDTTASTRSQVPPSIQESPHETSSQASENGSHSVNGFPQFNGHHAAVFGGDNPALNVVNGKESKDPLKRRKPKNNIVKSNSAFVSRVIPHESLSKRLQEHSPNGLYAFANVNRALQWLDLSAPNKEEHLTKILFTKAHALCHDINHITKGPNHLDIVMGFSTGDIIWYEPMSQKYARINKNGAINASAVSDIRWLPNSENLFLASHVDGSLVVYDKEKEDAPFVAEDTITTVPEEASSNGQERKVSLTIKKSVSSKNQKANPVSYWKVCNSKVNSFAFSPDNQHLAVVCEDGSFRIIDFLKERLQHHFTSYYGGFTCVCWSPDGRYVVTGGQDDLVSIWSLEDKMLVARCQGHNSWVTAVAFDPWRCDERNYRIGSVGEDCRLLLWDFSVSMLHRPRAASVRMRNSVTSTTLKMQRSQTNGSVSRLRSNSNLTTATTVDEEEIVHPVESRARTSMLPPVMAKKADDHPLAWLGFEEDYIVTSCNNGHIRTWDRPKEGAGSDDGALSTTSASASTSVGTVPA